MNSRASIAATIAGAAIAATAIAGPARAQWRDHPSLDRDGAKLVMAAALAEASRLGAPGGAIAIVDDGGHPMLLERIDGTFDAGALISIGKARTAANFKKPSRAFEDLINQGRIAMTTLDGFTPLIGGIPIVVNGEVVGAIGVSGAASADQDEQIAIAGAKAAAAFGEGPMGPPVVTYLERSVVDAAFAKGAPLLEVGSYKVHASRRIEPGKAEVHERDTDVIYVLDGSATIVTGGEVEAGETIAPAEIRGAAIRGGETRVLHQGDVMVVPNGVPHRFTEVSAPFLYYVVKVSS
jgi:glc operon protein GlcG